MVKSKYQIENSVDWEEYKCWVYNFPLQVNDKGSEYEESKMSYTDFLIRKEHKFLTKSLLFWRPGKI